MIFKYGDLYIHDPYTVKVVDVKYESEYTPLGIISQSGTMKVVGTIKGTSVDDLTTKILAVELAYGKVLPLGDKVGFWEDDNITKTAHIFEQGASYDGVQVKSFRWVDGEVEYATKRTFELEIEASTEGIISPTPPDNKKRTSESETLATISTGDAKYVVRTVLSGDPIKQQVSTKTPTQASQQGQATSKDGYPTPTDPLTGWSANEDKDRRRIRRVKRQQGKDWLYTTSWNYTFSGTAEFTF